MKNFTLCLLLLNLLCFLAYPAQSQEFDGYALYNATNQNTAYLIDKNGDIAHTWSLSHPCNYAVLMLESGNIIRGAVRSGNTINGAAVGGLVQEIDPQGNVIWEFEYSSSDYVAHHDISIMPDGNVLLTAWEVKNSTELDDYGYTGSSNVRYPTHFIEVSQVGDTEEGEIVWEWHIWDHLIQDVDPNKPNYGVVVEHPELMDINVATSSSGGGPMGGGGDWFHVNGVDYNEDLDQITFSSRFLSEIFIIDHSTTTEEAASHSGGNAGRGGDFLYRWGNPSNFGASGTQRISAAVHDARWITDDGRPRGGYIQFFNNEGENNGNSVVDAIELPFAADGYNYEWTSGQAYAPESATWRHTCEDNADGQSASNSLPNGNVFVNLSRGYMYEATANGDVIWQYAEGPAKAFRYTCDHPGIQVLTSTGVIEELCQITSTTNISNRQMEISPNPSDGIFYISGLRENEQIESIQVLDLLGNTVAEISQATAFDLYDQAAGIYVVKIELQGAEVITQKISLVK